MALPPESFDDWLKRLTCPTCHKEPAEAPENQRVSCTCGSEYIVLEAEIEDSAEKIKVYWTMPVDEFFDNINDVWGQLRDGG